VLLNLKTNKKIRIVESVQSESEVYFVLRHRHCVMSSQSEMRMVPHLPSMVLEKILQYIPNTSDRKNCRLVCFNWLYIVDTRIGLEIKLTKANKAKLFASGLLRHCTSLKIYESAGMLNWYVCYFSATKLKSVEIRQNILSDNWKLLLEACKSLEILTVTAHANITRWSSDKGYLKSLKTTFKFPALFVEDKINHAALRRLVFKEFNFLVSNPEQGVESDFVSAVNLLNTIGICPTLQQVIMILCTPILPYFENIKQDTTIKTALLSLMERNSTINSIGILSELTSFHDMTVWDELLQKNKSCIVHRGGFYLNWREIFDRLTLVDTAYFRFNEIEEFESLRENILMQSPNLKKLFLVMDVKGIIHLTHPEFDCALYLRGLSKLTELSVCPCRFGLLYSHPYTLINLDALTRNNIFLQYFYLSLPVSEINFDAIFAMPHLKELQIKYQESGTEFKKRHFDMAIAHKRLKFIFWEKALQEKWNEFNSAERNEDWNCVQLRQKKVRSIINTVNVHNWVNGVIVVANSWKQTTILVDDEGYIMKSKWAKKFDKNSVVFNKSRLNEDDMTRIKEIVK